MRLKHIEVNILDAHKKDVTIRFGGLSKNYAKFSCFFVRYSNATKSSRELDESQNKIISRFIDS